LIAIRNHECDISDFVGGMERLLLPLRESFELLQYWLATTDQFLLCSQAFLLLGELSVQISAAVPEQPDCNDQQAGCGGCKSNAESVANGECGRGGSGLLQIAVPLRKVQGICQCKSAWAAFIERAGQYCDTMRLQQSGQWSGVRSGDSEGYFAAAAAP
jgi:hypothetical protein